MRGLTGALPVAAYSIAELRVISVNLISIDLGSDCQHVRVTMSLNVTFESRVTGLLQRLITDGAIFV